MRHTRIGALLIGAALVVASPWRMRAQAPCYQDQTIFAKQVMGLTVATDGIIYYADYSGGTVGILELQHNRLTPLVSGLNHPMSVEAAGQRVYFIESGTDAGHYHDGTLSVFNPGTGARALIATGLEYPVSLFVDAAENVYVLEAAGSSTSYGGHDRLLKFAPGSAQPTVVIPSIPSPAAVVMNSQGGIVIGSYGGSIPGDNGSLLYYAPGGTTPEILAGGLPAVQDLAIDRNDNLYLAGFGSDGGTMTGIALVLSGSSAVVPIKTGVRAWCLAPDTQGRIHYSTLNPVAAIRQLTPCSGPPLLVTLTTPTSDAIFQLPTNVVLTAAVSESEGLVTNVTFFNGGRQIGEAVAPPFSFEWIDPPPGKHVLSAVAGDIAGNWGFSSLVSVTVISQSNSPVHYVNPASPNPTPPYTSWETAAETIQEAVDIATAGDEIVVTNGVYAAGGIPGNARVAVTIPLHLRSVNGPQFTVIKGLGRCVTLPAGASLSGFTLTNGSTPTGLLFDGNGYPINPDRYSGGGVFCPSPTTIISNCVLVANTAQYAGGGAYGGTLINCTLTNNTAGWGGGVAGRPRLVSSGGRLVWVPGCVVVDSVLAGNRANDSGGGAYGDGGASGCTLNHSTVINNAAGVDGSAARNCTLNACDLTGNSSSLVGSAARDCILNNCLLRGNAREGSRYGTLNNCTLTGNQTGAYGGRLNNCIVYGNSVEYAGGSVLYFCCTRYPPANGLGNVTSLDRCIDGGNNIHVKATTDFAGRPRIVGGSVDIGAYEFQGPFNDWLQQYGLSTNGIADFADSDSDGLNNWKEWIARTDPTNALSALRLVNATHGSSGMMVTWQSEPHLLYTLERSTNLGATPAFQTLATDIIGQPGTTTYIDTEAGGAGPGFYRVEAQPDSRPFAYANDGSTITITGYSGPGGAITIPTEINGMPVARIGNYAFYLNTALTSIVIPEGVTSIGAGAFFNCSSLTNATIPNSVTNLGKSAFQSCYHLTTISIPNGVSIIGDAVFSSCIGLTSITIPASVTKIGASAFASCSSLASISIPYGVASLGNSAFQGCTSLTSITIPESVTDVGDSAFAHCSGLKGIHLPDSVVSLGAYAFVSCISLTNVSLPNLVSYVPVQAFSNCLSLAEVTIPASVIDIRDGAFSRCTNLTSAIIGSNVERIGTAAFHWCTSLAGMTIPDNVATIGDWAFFVCESLKSVTLGNGVATIGQHAFENCGLLTNAVLGSSVTSIGANAFSGTSLGSVTIPGGVTNIAAGAFAGCGSLTAINVAAANPAYLSIDGVLLDQSGTTLIQCPGGKTGAYDIPDGVTTIGPSAFGSGQLTSVTIPNSVTNIGAWAFNYCSGLTSVTIGNGVSYIGDGAFYYCHNLLGAYFLGNAPALGGPNVFMSVLGFPLGNTVYYMPGTIGWGPTFGGRPTAPWSPPNF